MLQASHFPLLLSLALFVAQNDTGRLSKSEIERMGQYTRTHGGDARELWRQIVMQCWLTSLIRLSLRCFSFSR